MLMNLIPFNTSHITCSKNIQPLSPRLFPCGNFPRIFSQVATSQMCNFPSRNFPNLHQPQRSVPQPILAAARGPHSSLRHLRRPNRVWAKYLWENTQHPFVTVNDGVNMLNRCTYGLKAGKVRVKWQKWIVVQLYICTVVYMYSFTQVYKSYTEELIFH